MNISDAPVHGVPASIPEELVPKAEISDISDNLDGETDASQSLNGSLKRRFPRQVSKKVKRLRRNRRLRRILMPKNALMSLHELMGSSLTEFAITPEERGFVASVSVHNTQYEGHGKSFFFSSVQPNISSISVNLIKFVLIFQASRKLQLRIMHRRKPCVISSFNA